VPIGPYIADFCCHSLNLIVEVDGGQHGEPTAEIADEARTRWLQGRGYTVLRFWNNDVLQNLDGVMTRIAEFVATPTPNPSPQGGGESPQKGVPMTVVRFDTNARMSQAVVHGNTVYLAGQVSAEPAGDVTGQTAAVLKQIDSLLERCGTSKEKILSATIYLADIATFGAMNKAWEAWVPKGECPARTTLEAALAGPEFLVEITVVAAKG
jgi:enamine deaminase RidA (YjgF/YER057c/UK114 family)